MNLVLLFDDDFLSARCVRLRGRRLEHVLSVHRVSVGDSLRVGILGGCIGRGHITALDAHALEMDVSFECPPPPKLPLTLVVALPRPKALNRIIAAATSLGVGRIVLLNAWRVEKSYWNSTRLHEANLLHQRVLGLEQAVDTILPELHIARFFSRFVKDDLPLLASQTTRLVAHPLASVHSPTNIDEPCTLVLGPEGGFIPDELAALEGVGFRAVSLGTRILRTEVAMAALTGRLFSVAAK